MCVLPETAAQITAEAICHLRQKMTSRHMHCHSNNLPHPAARPQRAPRTPAALLCTHGHLQQRTGRLIRHPMRSLAPAHIGAEHAATVNQSSRSSACMWPGHCGMRSMGNSVSVYTAHRSRERPLAASLAWHTLGRHSSPGLEQRQTAPSWRGHRAWSQPPPDRCHRSPPCSTRTCSGRRSG